jgi:hypothetical protein
LSQFSALSALAALAASVPPFFFTSAELRMPVEGFARITGSWVAGVFERMTTVYFEGAEIVPRQQGTTGCPSGSEPPAATRRRRRGQRRPVGEVDVPLELERCRSFALSLAVNDETRQRDRMREVAARCR